VIAYRVIFGITIRKLGIKYLLGNQFLSSKCFLNKVISFTKNSNTHILADTRVKNAAVLAI